MALRGIITRNEESIPSRYVKITSYHGDKLKAVFDVAEFIEEGEIKTMSYIRPVEVSLEELNLIEIPVEMEDSILVRGYLYLKTSDMYGNCVDA